MKHIFKIISIYYYSLKPTSDMSLVGQKIILYLQLDFEIEICNINRLWDLFFFLIRLENLYYTFVVTACIYFEFWMFFVFFWICIYFFSDYCSVFQHYSFGVAWYCKNYFKYAIFETIQEPIYRKLYIPEIVTFSVLLCKFQLFFIIVPDHNNNQLPVLLYLFIYLFIYLSFCWKLSFWGFVSRIVSCISL